MGDNHAGDKELTLSSYLETAKFVSAASSATRLTNKLKTAVRNGELYETHQILTTVYFRFNAHKEKIEPLIDLLYHGAIYLLEHGEFTSGQEIALLFLETSAKRLQALLADPDCGESVKQHLLLSSISHHEKNRTLDLDICTKASDIAIRLPEEELGRPKFIAESLRLLSPRILNRDLLHNVIANRFWQSKDYVNARYHFLHCASIDNAHDVARLLVEFHIQKGNKSERDLFITQFILQFLCIQHPIDAPPRSGQQYRQQHASIGPSNSTVSRKSRNSIRLIAKEIVSTFTQQHPTLDKIELPVASLSLLNFLHFTISILGIDKAEANTYKALLDTYRPVWSRDPNYQSYLNRIGVIYFGLVDQSKQQQQQGGGFFNNILMSLLEASDDEEDTSTPEPAGEPFVTSCDEVD